MSGTRPTMVSEGKPAAKKTAAKKPAAKKAAAKKAPAKKAAAKKTTAKKATDVRPDFVRWECVKKDCTRHGRWLKPKNKATAEKHGKTHRDVRAKRNQEGHDFRVVTAGDVS